MALARRIILLAFFAGLLVPPAVSVAQIPDPPYKNTTILPKDMPKSELVGMLRSFSMSLGVRCSHCHVPGENPEDLGSFDFASDDKDTKKIAREMMKLSGDINKTLAASIGSMRPEPIQVRCVTCHHGVAKPQTLEQVLAQSLETSGTDSTVATYHRLRKEYYGAAAYDFGEWSLISIAETVSRDDNNHDAALALLNTNLEYHPESAGTYARIAETYLARGDRAQALANFDKALALAPDDPWLKRRVERVKSGQ
jgi:tetratricopeptide (TPR) repeat protein